MTKIGCNKDTLIPLDYANLAVHTFSQGMREACFDSAEITGDSVDATGKWDMHSSLVVDVPRAGVGSQFIANCAQINRAINSTQEYLAPYKNPYSGVTTRKHPQAGCAISGTIQYVLDQSIH